MTGAARWGGVASTRTTCLIGHLAPGMGAGVLFEAGRGSGGGAGQWRRGGAVEHTPITYHVVRLVENDHGPLQLDIVRSSTLPKSTIKDAKLIILKGAKADSARLCGLGAPHL